MLWVVVPLDRLLPKTDAEQREPGRLLDQLVFGYFIINRRHFGTQVQHQ